MVILTEAKSGKTGLLYLYNCQLVSRKNAKYQFSKQEKEMDLK